MNIREAVADIMGERLAPKRQAHHLGKPDDRIHKATPSDDRGNIRSATPRGFARAVFEANRPQDRRAAA